MKKVLLTFLLIFFLFPWAVFAQDESIQKHDRIFKAEVTEVLQEKEKKVSGEKTIIQQKLKLKGLEGEFKEKQIIFNGIDGLEVIKSNVYEKGDEVLVAASYNENGEVNYYVTDHVRTPVLLWLTVVFIVCLLVVGQFKGLRAILALAVSFFVIIKYIIPSILSGVSPIIPSVIGSLLILIFIVYITEGFKIKSHLVILSTFFSLLVIILVSWLFVEIAKLTGVSGDDVSLLVTLGDYAINFKGLLLAGIIIGTLGVLDDVIVSQVSTVEQIFKTDKYQTGWEVFKKSYQVGVSHISSMTNTLFLAYAGVSLPLLLFFVSGQTAFSTWEQALNNEAIATEIVRTLAGSIGLILAVPISTAIATWWFSRKGVD